MTSEESARLLAEVKAASQERMKRELATFLQAVAHAASAGLVLRRSALGGCLDD